MKFFPRVLQKLYVNSHSDSNRLSNSGERRNGRNSVGRRRENNPISTPELELEVEPEENQVVWDFLGKMSVCVISVVYDMAKYLNILPYSTLPIPEEELKDDPRDCIHYPKETIKWQKWFDLYFVVFNGFCLSFCVTMHINYKSTTALHYFYFVVYLVTGSHWLISLKNVERQVVMVNQVMWLAKNYTEVSTAAYLKRLWRTILIFIPLITCFCLCFLIMNLAHIIHCHLNHDALDPNWKMHSFGWMPQDFKENSPQLIFWISVIWEMYFASVSIINVLLGIFQLVIFRIQVNVMQYR